MNSGINYPNISTKLLLNKVSLIPYRIYIVLSNQFSVSVQVTPDNTHDHFVLFASEWVMITWHTEYTNTSQPHVCATASLDPMKTDDTLHPKIKRITFAWWHMLVFVNYSIYIEVLCSYFVIFVFLHHLSFSPQLRRSKPICSLCSPQTCEVFWTLVHAIEQSRHHSRPACQLCYILILNH